MSKAPKEARRKAGKEKAEVLEGLVPLNLHAAGMDVGHASTRWRGRRGGTRRRGRVLAVSRPPCSAWGNG